MTASRVGVLQRWDVETGTAHGAELNLHTGVFRLAVSPDASGWIALCGDATARLFDIGTGRQRFPPLRHRGRIWVAEFTRDGRRLVTASVDRTAQIWDARTGLPLGPPLRHDGAVLVARFSPDGTLVATGGEDRMVRLWDAQTGRQLAAPLWHHQRVWILAFSADGRRLLTAADSDEARVWDVASGLPLTEPFRHGQSMLNAWFVPGEPNAVLTVTRAGKLTRWHFPLAPTPSPPWLPELGEAIAGQRLDETGTMALAPSDILRKLNAGDETGETLPAVGSVVADRSCRASLAALGKLRPFHTGWPFHHGSNIFSNRVLGIL